MRESLKSFMQSIKGCLQSDKVNKVFKKIFNKKTIIAAIIIVVLISAARVGFSLAFEVNGTVTKIDGSNITVTNFFRTQTVNVGDYPVATNGLQVGDRIEISKNLSGQIYSIRGGNQKHISKGNEKINDNGKFGGKQRFNEGNMKR